MKRKGAPALLPPPSYSWHRYPKQDRPTMSKTDRTRRPPVGRKPWDQRPPGGCARTRRRGRCRVVRFESAPRPWRGRLAGVLPRCTLGAMCLAPHYATNSQTTAFSRRFRRPPRVNPRRPWFHWFKPGLAAGFLRRQDHPGRRHDRGIRRQPAQHRAHPGRRRHQLLRHPRPRRD